MSIVTDGRMQRLWTDAQQYPEWATTRLWEHIFNRVIFTESKWVVSSQQPPTHQAGDLRRVDLVVEEIDGHAQTVGTLLFVEAKRAAASPSDVMEVEYQAFTAACAYFVETGIERLWTMTCVGTRARLWIFDQKSNYLIPFVPPGDGLADIDEYLEISTHGTTLVEGLKFCKDHMRPPSDLLETTGASPRPANVTLPPSWHDDEVTIVDSQRRS
ncbi:hypothetical protein ANO14919_129380 [Xylariales sp. No.14919]|nr:hypothetical protein ANO14919_129380 [Xylariales sp. No.14919]